MGVRRHGYWPKDGWVQAHVAKRDGRSILDALMTDWERGDRGKWPCYCGLWATARVHRRGNR